LRLVRVQVEKLTIDDVLQRPNVTQV
jgi:hypothetical protein